MHACRLQGCGIFVKNSSMRFLFLLLAFWQVGQTAVAQAGQSSTSSPKKSVNNGVERPRLVVGLVVDQMRWDYLYRYQHQYGKDGFNRLLNKGFSYEHALIPYTPSVTAAGHTSIYTGTVPAFHGIISNYWIDKRSNRSVYCSEDTLVAGVGTQSKAGKMSPRNMQAPTISDELRLATNFKSRVYGISLKDRGGIFPAGYSGNAAYWLDESGNWISSTWYMKELPKWVNRFNGSRRADSLMMRNWNLLLPKDAYDQSAEDDNRYEKTIVHEKTVTFPHELASQIGKNYEALRQSPHGNTLSFDFTKELIRNEKLGASGQTDMLCLSLSSPDYAGHQFGTHSVEMQDLYLRLDQDLASFLAFLDKEIGEGKYLLFLTADHGVSNTPAFLEDHRIATGALQSSQLAKDINAHIESKTGISKAVRGIVEYQVYLNHILLDSLEAKKDDITEMVIRYLKTRDEIVTAFSYSDMDDLVLPQALKEQFVSGYNEKRSGDIQFFYRPYVSDARMTGAEHGSWYTYDTHIPLVWYGWNIKKGRSGKTVYMTDIAPTLAYLLRIQMPPASIGKVLEELE